MTTPRPSFFVSFAVCLAVFFCTTLAATRPLRASFDEWAFDADVFNARLRVDWRAQDAPRVPEATPRALAELVLRDCADADSDAITPSELDALNLRRDELARRDADEDDWDALYYDACALRRNARLADMREIAPAFVYVKHYVLGASHYAYTEDISDEPYFDSSVNRQPGGALCLATLGDDGTIRHEVLVETPSGTIRDPEVSWDAKEIVFSMRDDFLKDDFHLYVYNLETRETRQITFGLGVADIEPAWTPDGGIVFVSTRCVQNIDCWWTYASNLYACDAQGRFLRRLGMDQVSVNYPKTLDDGRVIYTRWEYNDRGHIYTQPLFQMNPDGTAQTEFYGNNSYFPTSILHARGIPGTDSVVGILSGHHTYQQGKLATIDRAEGNQGNAGIRFVAPGRPQPQEVVVDRYGQEGELFAYPYALDDANLLVAYLPEGSQERTYKTPFGVYWFDLDARRELLAFDPAISALQPAPLWERDVPTTRPSQVDWNKDSGAFYVQDVYEGPGLQGVARGEVKKLRVVELLYRPFSAGWNWCWGEAGESLVSGPCSIGNGSWDAKRVLGEVPVEEDGSAFFEVPALTPVYFQLLDSNGDVLQTMRSWSTLQPGETFACVGCHEPKSSVVANAATLDSATTIAMKKGPARLQKVLDPPAGFMRDAGFDFVRDVQPILDRRCVACHTGDDGAPFSLKGNEEANPEEERQEIYAVEKRRFTVSYLNLTQNGRHEGKWVRWLGVQDRPEMIPPRSRGAVDSPLIALFRAPDGTVAGQDEAHRNVEITPEELKIIAMWIDLLVPFCGDYYAHNRWSDGDRAYYRYFKEKRDRSAAIVDASQRLRRDANASGILPAPSDFPQLDFGGLEDRKRFVDATLQWRAPSILNAPGVENVYRNVALNPDDAQAFDRMDLKSYPHASSNSEFAFADVNAAKNAIDGVKADANAGEGENAESPAWIPNLRDDLFLCVEFGCDVEIDKCVISLRADPRNPDDPAVFWEKGTLRFSDGSTLEVDFAPTSAPQTFSFDKKRVSYVVLENLRSSQPLKIRGVTELEFWGVVAEE